MALILNCQFGKKGKMKSATGPQRTDACLSFQFGGRSNFASPLGQRGEDATEEFELTSSRRLNQPSPSRHLLVRGICLAPKALCQLSLGHRPSGSGNICDPALKAQLNGHCDDDGLRFGDESRFQRWDLARTIFLGRCPRLQVDAAPLALNRNAKGEANPFALEWIAFVSRPK
jgi:hypothetical protein